MVARSMISGYRLDIDDDYVLPLDGRGRKCEKSLLTRALAGRRSARYSNRARFKVGRGRSPSL